MSRSANYPLIQSKHRKRASQKSKKINLKKNVTRKHLLDYTLDRHSKQHLKINPKNKFEKKCHTITPFRLYKR